MTPEQLTQFLKTTEPELLDSLSRIREFLARWWQTNYMPWFTDHGPSHSERVSSYALSLIPDPLQSGTELTSVELYILTAAALLHDIGMQVLVRQLGDLAPKDYDEVRKLHPAQSYQLIVTKGVEIGLPGNDPQVTAAVALVAQAHGSEYFQQTLVSLSALSSVRNQRCRCDLLGALLLISDELDLHYERARFPDPAQAALVPISCAHSFKHHYVTQVGIDDDENGKTCITLSLDFPRELGLDDREVIQAWIISKLQEQMGVVSPTIETGLRGQLRFSRRLRVKSRDEVAPTRRLIDFEALSIIREEVARAQIVDYRAAIKTLSSSLPHARVLGVLGLGGSEDPDGREELLRWAEIRTVQRSFAAVSRRLSLNQGGAPSDVLEEWATGLGGSPVFPAATHERSRRAALLDQIHRQLKARTASAVLLVSSLETLPTSGLRWLVNKALRPLLLQFPALSVVYTSTSDQEMVSLPDHTCVRLRSPDPVEVAQYFGRFSDDPLGQVYLAAEKRYCDLRVLAATHALKLRT